MSTMANRRISSGSVATGSAAMSGSSVRCARTPANSAPQNRHVFLVCGVEPNLSAAIQQPRFELGYGVHIVPV